LKLQYKVSKNGKNPITDFDFEFDISNENEMFEKHENKIIKYIKNKETGPTVSFAAYSFGEVLTCVKMI